MMLVRCSVSYQCRCNSSRPFYTNFRGRVLSAWYPPIGCRWKIVPEMQSALMRKAWESAQRPPSYFCFAACETSEARVCLMTSAQTSGTCAIKYWYQKDFMCLSHCCISIFTFSNTTAQFTWKFSATHLKLGKCALLLNCGIYVLCDQNAHFSRIKMANDVDRSRVINGENYK